LALDPQRRRNPLDRKQRFGRGALAEIAARDRDAQSVDAVIDAWQHGLAWTFQPDRVVRIVSLHRVIGERKVPDVARERPEMVEARDEWERARPRQPTVGRLEPEDAAQRGGHADRAVGVGAERQWHEAPTDRAG